MPVVVYASLLTMMIDVKKSGNEYCIDLAMDANAYDYMYTWNRKTDCFDIRIDSYGLRVLEGGLT